MQFLRMRPLPKLLLQCFKVVCARNFVRTMHHIIFVCLLEPGTMCWTWNLELYVVEQVCCRTCGWNIYMHSYVDSVNCVVTCGWNIWLQGCSELCRASVNCVITCDVNL
jgi:hypothetical protein